MSPRREGLAEEYLRSGRSQSGECRPKTMSFEPTPNGCGYKHKRQVSQPTPPAGARPLVRPERATASAVSPCAAMVSSAVPTSSRPRACCPIRSSPSTVPTRDKVGQRKAALSFAEGTGRSGIGWQPNSDACAALGLRSQGTVLTTLRR